MLKTKLTFLPSSLVLLRFLLSPLIWWSIWLDASRAWFLAGFLIAFLSDIFDGIIARRLNVVTPLLRLADGWVDLWFYGWVIAGLWLAHQPTLVLFARPILIILALQFSESIFSWFKFGKPTSYHAYSAKAFGIALFIAIISLMGLNYAGIVLSTALVIGIINSTENWLISLTLPVWTTDVPSIFHAWQRRKHV